MKGMVKGTGKIANLSLVALAAAVTLALAFGPAQAAVIVVPTDSNKTIQAGIDAATPGDTVKLKTKCAAPGTLCGPNGEYHEAPDIDKKLTLNCMGGVIDGAIGSDGPGGPLLIGGDGIDVTADGVTIERCTVQNFRSGHGIDVGGDKDDFTLKNCTLRHNNTDGLELDGDDFLVRNNTAVNNGKDGFDIGSSGGTVVRNVAISNGKNGFRTKSSDSKKNKYLRNRAFQNDSHGFNIEGEEHTISGNRSELNDGIGFDLGGPFDMGLVERNLARGNKDDGFNFSDADDNTIRRNVGLNNGNGGFDLDCGDHNTFWRNVAIGNEDEGFDSCGDDNEYTRNRAFENQSGGFFIDCDESGDPDTTCGGPIIGNRAIGNSGESGFLLQDFVETTVSGNRSLGNERHGFRCTTCNDVLFENNLARRNLRHGFTLKSKNGVSDKVVFKNNRSIRNTGNGFKITGNPDNLEIIDNSVKRNGGDGIDINDAPDDVLIEGNRVFNNGGTGIETNDDDGDALTFTTIKDNTMKGNRTDLAGRGDNDNSPGACTLNPAIDGPPTGTNTFVTGGFDVCTPNTGAAN